MNKKSWTTFFTLTAIASSPVMGGEAVMAPPTTPLSPPVEDPFADRLLGDMGGFRTTLAERGIAIDLDGWYSYQNVIDGGRVTGRDDASLFTGRLGVKLDTGKAGLWPGGFLSARLEGRAGDNVFAKAGTTSPVNNAALLPLVPGTIGDDTYALNELTFTQFFSEKIGFTAGLLNTDAGDTNPFTGSLGSHNHFMNTALLYSPVVSSTVPTATLGGGLIFIPNERITGTFIVLGTNETAGNNPFDDYEGTTFSTEWAFKHQLAEKPGGITLGATYGINQARARITENPRILLRDAIQGAPLTTQDDAWSVYGNAFQYLSGDDQGGWGVFGRFGFSDGDVSAVDWHLAGGVGGVGLFPGRDADRWGLGAYYQEFTNAGILNAAGVDNEVGGELFYNIQVTSWMNLTLNAQVIDSALPQSDTATVLGARVGIRF